MKAWNNKIWDFPRRRHGLILRELLDGEITGITASMFGPIWSDIKDESSDSERLPRGSRIGGPIYKTVILSRRITDCIVIGLYL